MYFTIIFNIENILSSEDSLIIFGFTDLEFRICCLKNLDWFDLEAFVKKENPHSYKDEPSYVKQHYIKKALCSKNIVVDEEKLILVYNFSFDSESFDIFLSLIEDGEVEGPKIQNTHIFEHILYILVVLEYRNNLIIQRIINKIEETDLLRIWCNVYHEINKKLWSKKISLEISRSILKKIENFLSETNIIDLINQFLFNKNLITSTVLDEIVLEFKTKTTKKKLSFLPVLKKLLEFRKLNLYKVSSSDILNCLRDFLEVILINILCESYNLKSSKYKLKKISVNVFSNYPLNLYRDLNICLIDIVTHLIERDFFICCQMSWKIDLKYFNLVWFMTFHRNINIRRLSFDSINAFYCVESISEVEKLFKEIYKILIKLKYEISNGMVIIDKNTIFENANFPLFEFVFVYIDKGKQERFLKLYEFYFMDFLLGECVFHTKILNNLLDYTKPYKCLES